MYGVLRRYALAVVVTKCCGKNTAPKKAEVDVLDGRKPGQVVRWRRCASCGAMYCARGHRLVLSEVRWASYGEVMSGQRLDHLERQGKLARMMDAGKVVLVEPDGGGVSDGWFELRANAPVCRESDDCVAEDDAYLA